MGSKTRIFLELSERFSNPTMVMEWPVLFSPMVSLDTL